MKSIFPLGQITNFVNLRWNKNQTTLWTNPNTPDLDYEINDKNILKNPHDFSDEVVQDAMCRVLVELMEITEMQRTQ